MRSGAAFAAAGVAAAASLGLPVGAARAAEPVAPPVVSTTQVYDRAFFAQYSLSNAEDMLRRIPGVATVLDSSSVSQARGLGAGTEQVLIDGKRLASKSNSAAATLRRIPAASVERVELIRGSTGEVQSDGLVVNVVLSAGVSLGGVGNFEAVYRFGEGGWSDVDGLISWAADWGPLSYVIGYENAAWAPLGLVPNSGTTDWSRRDRDERYFYPSGVLQELRPQKWRREHDRNTFTGNGTYQFANGDTLRANALYQLNPVKQVDVTALTRFNPAGAATGSALEYHYNKTRIDTFEIGGELEKALGRAKLKVIALHNRSQTTQLDFRNRTETTGVLAELGRSGSDQHKGEDVVQTSLELPLTSRQTVTLGAEAARNTLTQDIDVFFDLDRDGRLEQIAIPTSFARVAEIRGEVFVLHSWRPIARLTVDSALRFEMSRITTNYPDIPVRTLNYIKPRIDARYQLTSLDRLRLRLERTVGQLDFTNFVPTYNVVDTRIDLGNAELLPQISKSAALSWEHRLPRDGGQFAIELSYRTNTNFAAFVPFGFNSAGLPISRRGNNPTSLGYLVEISGALRLTPLGLPNAQITGLWRNNTSRARDVFNLRRRKGTTAFVNEFQLGLRHDLTRWRAAYGVEAFETTGDQLLTDVRNFEYFSRGVRVNAFVEKTLWGGYSLRLDAYNLNGAREYKRRLLYSFSQLDGAIARTETYTELRDRRFAVRLRGKF